MAPLLPPQDFHFYPIFFFPFVTLPFFDLLEEAYVLKPFFFFFPPVFFFGFIVPPPPPDLSKSQRPGMRSPLRPFFSVCRPAYFIIFPFKLFVSLDLSLLFGKVPSVFSNFFPAGLFLFFSDCPFPPGGCPASPRLCLLSFWSFSSLFLT